jgi:hypothetical protein
MISPAEDTHSGWTRFSLPDVGLSVLLVLCLLRRLTTPNVADINNVARTTAAHTNSAQTDAPNAANATNAAHTANVNAADAAYPPLHSPASAPGNCT